MLKVRAWGYKEIEVEMYIKNGKNGDINSRKSKMVCTPKERKER